jgi:hypothetical protein
VQEKVWVGQRVTLIIELLSPGYFAGSPAFDLPSVPGILILQPDGRPVLGSEMIDHTNYTIQRHELAVFSQRAGHIKIPSFPVRFSTRQGAVSPVEQRLQTNAVSFDANLPPGAEALATLISARDLTATEKWQPEPGAAKAGDAFTRTITFSATDVPAMALPPFPATEIPGLGVYPKAPMLLDQNERGVTRGERQDSLTYVCQRLGQFAVPAARFTWWDLDHHQLRTVDFPAHTFEVAPNPGLPVPPVALSSGPDRNLRAQIRDLGVVAVLIGVLAVFGWWTRRRRPIGGGHSVSGARSIWCLLTRPVRPGLREQAIPLIHQSYDPPVLAHPLAGAVISELVRNTNSAKFSRCRFLRPYFEHSRKLARRFL